MSSSCKKTSPLGMILFSKDQRRSPKIGTDPATDHGFSQDFSTFLWCFFLMCFYIICVFMSIFGPTNPRNGRTKPPNRWSIARQLRPLAFPDGFRTLGSVPFRLKVFSINRSYELAQLGNPGLGIFYYIILYCIIL